MKKEMHMPYFRTQDFEKSLILRSANAILWQVEWDEGGNKADFVFENAELCEEILDKHRRGKLKLKSCDVLVAYREVKNELFGQR